MSEPENQNPSSSSEQPPKKDGVRKIFLKRLEREGRLKDWYKTVREVQAETGKQFGRIVYQAMARMGYESPEREWEIHEKYLADEKAKLKTPTEVLREEIREERRLQNFEEALATLPPHASIEDRVKWIGAHPAMSRRARSKNPMQDVVLTVADIYAAHGTAPSQSAVHDLQHWANHATEFYKTTYASAKKASEEQSGTGVGTKDVGIDEIERLLAEVTRQ